jgi:hypothetical protein
MVDARPVPKVLHQIWLQGADAMPPDAARWSMQAKRAAQTSGWEYRLWSDEDLLGLGEYRSSRGLANTFAHLSDLGRYSILWHFGGMYVDVDTELVRMPTDDGPLGPLVGAWRMEGNTAAVAAPAHHPFIRGVLDLVMRSDPYEGPPSQINVRMWGALIASGVNVWPAKCWQGGDRWRYGNHLGQHLAWGSMLQLGDTFPPGAKV